MKKTLIAAACMLVSLGVYAQGVVNFANASASRITYDAASGAKAGTFIEAGAFKIQLYFGSQGTTDDTSLTALSVAPALSGPVPGRFLGGNRTIPPASGAVVTVQVRAWSAAFDTYADANTPAGAAAGAFIGKSNLFDADPSDTAIAPPGQLTGLTAFTVSPVPEPSTIALGLLGASVLLFRRRK